MDDYYDKLAKANARVDRILVKHECACGHKARLEVVMCPNHLEPVAVVVYCMCDGNGVVCEQIVYLDTLYSEEVRND